MSILHKSTSRVSSRRQIEIKGAQDGVLILPGNQYRVVLQVSSINFELKSEAEQDAVISNYQSFLNSLSLPLQIIVRIREMDMDKYIGDFKAKVAEETETVYRDQTLNYTEFVQGLISTNKILARNFYVIIPHRSNESDFSLVKEQLALHGDIVGKGLNRLGMQIKQLSSLEVIDLFYSFYSPIQAKRQPLHDQTMQLINNSYI